MKIFTKTSMMKLIILSIFVIHCCMATDVDFVDTESEIDEEAELKCDACKVVSKKFAESFLAAQTSKQSSLKEDEMIEAAESTCDDIWEGYGVKMVNNVERLSGPDADEEVKSSPGKFEVDNPVWTRRLQDMCDELLAEVPDEATMYRQWSSDRDSLTPYLCEGEGSLGSCVTKDWGPWPGDDYDDYDDDIDYPHDEF